MLCTFAYYTIGACTVMVYACQSCIVTACGHYTIGVYAVMVYAFQSCIVTACGYYTIGAKIKQVTTSRNSKRNRLSNPSYSAANLVAHADCHAT